MLCVAVGSILPLLSPGINSTSHPAAPDQPSARQASPQLQGRAQLLCHSPRVAYTSLLSKAQLQKAPNTFSVLTFLWNLQGPAAVTHLCHLFIISTSAPQSHTELWSLSSLLWNNLLEPLIYGLLLFWVSLHNTKATKLGKSKGLSKCFSSTFKSVMNSFISVLQM